MHVFNLPFSAHPFIFNFQSDVDNSIPLSSPCYFTVLLTLYQSNGVQEGTEINVCIQATMFYLKFSNYLPRINSFPEVELLRQRGCFHFKAFGRDSQIALRESCINLYRTNSV